MKDKPDALSVPDSMLLERGVRRLEDPHDDVLRSMMNGLATRARFVPRAQGEFDPRWRQLIPYAYVVRNGSILAYERRAEHTDQRLAGRLSIGFGGHVEAQDGPGGASLLTTVLRCLHRELQEECGLAAPDWVGTFVGTIVDDGSLVNLVHAGLVFRVEVVHTQLVEARDEAKTSAWLPIPDFLDQVVEPEWEGWTYLAAKEGLVW